MAPRGTTLRNVRIAEALWDAARATADERGENVSDVIRAALTQYVEGRFTLPPAQP